jgi:EamA domain-containing membrane protein RarD
MMNASTKSYLEVHLAVFLFGVTGLFGKFLSISPLIIVLGRVFVSALFIFIWLKIVGESLKLNSKKDLKSLIINGILLVVHWTMK